jgi:hypothetical protein
VRHTVTFKPPDTIRIGPIIYRVELVDDLRDPDDPEKELEGLIEYSKEKISIVPGLSDNVGIALLLHESLHGMFYQAGQINHKESHVLALGYALIDFMRDNPEIVKAIMGPTKMTPSMARMLGINPASYIDS